MKKAFEEWEDISRDPRAWAEYESRRKAILDDDAAVREAELRAQEAEEKGAVIGALQAAENIARNLLLSEMDGDDLLRERLHSYVHAHRLSFSQLST